MNTPDYRTLHKSYVKFRQFRDVGPPNKGRALAGCTLGAAHQIRTIETSYYYYSRRPTIAHPIRSNRSGIRRGSKMSNNGIGVRDSLTRRLAEAERDRLHRRVVPIVDCIRKMRAEGLADNEIAGLFRHAAEELEAATKDDEVEPTA
jgi:hypothetical protein